MVKTIGVCGFVSTGSSAVVDFLKEFEENEVFDNFEFDLLISPDGIEDLAYKLNEGNLSTLSSSIAIDRYRKLCNSPLRKGLEISTKKHFYFLTEKYLKDISQVEWYNIHSNRKSNFSLFPDRFYEITKEYINNIFVSMGKQDKKNLIFDNIFNASNPQKSFIFFDNPRAIVVDRDPRDLYLCSKLIWPSFGLRQVPRNVENFVIFYRQLRKRMPYLEENHNILNIRFEDLIYKYKETTNKIINFLDLKYHSRPMMFFKPEISISNTRIDEIFSNHVKDINYIEKELFEYLYPFENYKNVKRSGRIF